MSENITFRVAAHKFEVNPRFTAGHVCSAEDAAKLNSAMAKNLADVAKHELVAGVDPGIVQAILTGKAAEFSFGPAGKRKVGTDPIMVEARKIAKSLVLSAMRARGMDVKSLDIVDLAERIESLITKRPDLTVDEARKRHDAAQGIILPFLGDE